MRSGWAGTGPLLEFALKKLRTAPGAPELPSVTRKFGMGIWGDIRGPAVELVFAKRTGGPGVPALEFTLTKLRTTPGAPAMEFVPTKLRTTPGAPNIFS